MKYIFLTLFSMAAVALTGANSVNAVSPYDDYVNNVDELVLTAAFCDDLDISLNWSEYVRDSPTYGTSFEAAIDNGSWGVSLLPQYDAGSGINAVEVYWYEGGQMDTTFHSWGYIEATPITHSVLLHLTNPNTCEPTVSNYGTAYISSNDGSVFHYLYTGDVTYPPDYEGEIIRDTPPSPNPTSDNSPNMRIDSVINFKVTSSDQNFLTFDRNPFLCNEEGDALISPDEEGFAPLLYWQLYNDQQTQAHSDDILLKSGYQSATGQLEINFDDTGQDEGYRLTTWYSCGGTLEFPNPTHNHFKVTKDGLLDETSVFTSCISNEFPFIHLHACIGSMQALTAFATVGVPKFANAWQPNQNCNTLQVLDDWMHLENNPALCPQVPNYVRAAITPFVTFILGLITIKFIARQTGKEF